MTPGKSRELYVRAYSPRADLKDATNQAVIRAVGRVDPLGRELMRLRWLNDKGAFIPALRKAQPIVRAVLKERYRELPGVKAKRCAYDALQQWLVGICPKCQGRRYERVLGAPVLSDEYCPACLGTGGYVPDKYRGNHRHQLLMSLAVYNQAIGRSAWILTRELERQLSQP